MPRARRTNLCGAPRGNVRQSTICAAKHKNTFFLSFLWNKKTSFGWVVNVMLACLSRNSIVASTGPINLKYTHWRAHIFLMYIITSKAVWIWRKQLVWPFDHSLQPKAGILAPWSQRCLPHVGKKNKEAGHLVEDSRVFFFSSSPNQFTTVANSSQTYCPTRIWGHVIFCSESKHSPGVNCWACWT